MPCYCGHAADDHNADGLCNLCPCAVFPVHGYTVTLWCCGNGHPIALDMPSVTTIGRAAQRVAEAFGLDPEGQGYALTDMASGRMLEADEMVVKYDGVAVELVVLP